MQQSGAVKTMRNQIPGVTLTLEDYRRLVQEKYSQKMLAMECPKLYLSIDDLKEQPTDPQPLLYMTDLQTLLIFLLQGSHSKIKPRWCRLLRITKVKNIVVVVMNSVSDTDYSTYSHCLQNLNDYFKSSVDMVCSEQYGLTLTDDLFRVQPTSLEPKKIVKYCKPQYCTCKQAYIKSVNGENGEVISQWRHDKFDRTSLLLSQAELIQERIPVPVHTKAHTYTNFVFTRDTYETPTEQSPMYALDCEMCLTIGNRSELTRISIINENLDVMYDTFVKPHNKIVNYLTQYSGVTKALLDPVTTRLYDVQQKIRSLISPDAILVGHSINGDLRAMQMFHPFIIDTSVIYNTKGEHGCKTSLRDLSRIFLDRRIQKGSKGHSSAEDARATLELVLLKLQHDEAFGNCLLDGKMVPSFEVEHDWFTDMLNGKPPVPKPSPTNSPVKPNTASNSMENSDGSKKVGNDNMSKKRKLDETSLNLSEKVFEVKENKDNNAVIKVKKRKHSDKDKMSSEDVNNVKDVNENGDGVKECKKLKQMNNDNDSSHCAKCAKANDCSLGGKTIACICRKKKKKSMRNVDTKTVETPSSESEEHSSNSVVNGDNLSMTNSNRHINTKNNVANSGVCDESVKLDCVPSSDCKNPYCKFATKNKQKAFFFSRSSNDYSSLLEKAVAAKKSVLLVNEMGITAKTCQSLTSVDHVTTDTDKAARIQAQEAMPHTFMTWVRLRKYDKLLESEDASDVKLIEHNFKKMDKHSSKIFNAAPPHSVCITILPGRADDKSEHNAKVFLKVKPSQQT